MLNAPKIVENPKSFCCSHCRREIATRRGNEIIKGELIVEFKRTHKIKCSSCGRHTMFSIDTNPEKG